MRGILWQARYFVLDQHPTNPFRYSHGDQKTKFVTIPLQYVADVIRVGQDELHLTMDTHRDDTDTIKLRLKPGTTRVGRANSTSAVLGASPAEERLSAPDGGLPPAAGSFSAAGKAVSAAGK